MGGSSAAKRSRKTDAASQSSSLWAANGVSTGTASNSSPSTAPGNPRAGPERSANGALIREKHSAEGPKGSKVASAVLQTTLPAWVNVGIMVGLIFGGCCANVFALEAIVTDSPGSGGLITFTQFAVTFLFAIPNFLSLSAGPRSLFLSKRMIPLRSWMIYTAFFMTVNLLNNAAFAYKVSVPLHIILRSAGPVASMVIGYLYNSKRYTNTQILGVLMLSIGVVVTALADASSKGKSLDIGLNEEDDISTSMVGFAILALAMILAAFQGVYADRLYEKHGRDHWREALFYSHALSLPFLMSSYPKLRAQFDDLVSSPSVLETLPTTPVPQASMLLSTAATSTTMFESISPSALPSLNVSSANSAVSFLQNTLPSYPLIHTTLARTPIKILYLLLNALTQYLCIRGVHLLSAKSSSLTVTVVLNIRKLVSLILSVYLFGNVIVTGVLIGAICVFLGGGIYAYEGARLKNLSNKKALKEKTG